MTRPSKEPQKHIRSNQQLLSVNIDGALLDDIKMLAQHEGCNLSDYVQKILNEKRNSKSPETLAYWRHGQKQIS